MLRDRRILFMLLAIFIIIVIFLYIHNYTLNVKIINRSIDINENNFSAYFRGEDVTNDTKVTSNIYNVKTKKYEITFTYRKNNKEYSKVKKIFIKDVIGPNIQLLGEEVVTIKKGIEFKEPGYLAIDNQDGDITEKVKIKGDVDVNVVGTYKMVYTASDSHKNLSSVTRTINVIE